LGKGLLGIGERTVLDLRAVPERDVVAAEDGARMSANTSTPFIERLRILVECCLESGHDLLVDLALCGFCVVE
jgi:hypothetical protein